MVARTNLGNVPGLIAAAALLIDYLLTAAVSLTASIEQIASAFPVLWPYRVLLALLCLGLIAWINLRGVQESGTLMAVPVYSFLVSYLGMLIWGLVRAAIDGPGSLANAAPPPTQPLTLMLLLHAFSAGCTALTGIEAISNGVPSFHPPEAKNAGQTLMVMALLMALLFVGSIGLTQFFAITSGAEETILSALARRLLGSGPLYVLVQTSTMAILVVAANTSFAGFPRLAAILAQDGFLPRQLTNLGDRLVFQNGILLLTLATAVLIVLFGGQSHALIPLFAVGVFLAFTLSQAGMVVHWWRVRGRGWWFKAAINGIGALATATVVLIVGISKFLEGAWLTLLLIPLLVFFFFKVHAHYQTIRAQLSMRGIGQLERISGRPRVVVPISGVHLGIANAINFACSISDQVTALYIELAPGASEHIREEWQKRWPDVPLEIVSSPYRSIIGPLLDFLDEIDRRYDDDRLTAVVLPEFIPARWWHGLLHNQTAWAIKTALLYRRRKCGYTRVIIDVPYHLQK